MDIRDASLARYGLVADLNVEAYREFAQSDSNQQLWQKLTELDNQAVAMLAQQVESMAQSGKLRPGQPGQTASR